MGFHENPAMVRVDYFREGGKWYMTEALDMGGVFDSGAVGSQAAVKAAIKRAGRSDIGMIAVVLEPHCRLSYPVMVRCGC